MINFKNISGQLNEIKKGQTGTGLLIENDGHINNDCDIVKQIREDIENPALKLFCPEKFIVSAVFQKYGIKNANGRIYPENVLKTQVEKYINERVATRCAIGALDHPACQLADTRILTEKGWKYISEVEVGENILTVTPEKKIEIKPILKKIDQPYKGKLIHLKGRFIDIKVTPNHKFPILGRNYEWKGFFTAQDILEGNIPGMSSSYLFKTGEWEGEQEETFTIKRLNEDELSIIPSVKIREKYSHDVEINMETWLKFMGIYLSEGDSQYRRTMNGGCVHIYQKKQNIIDEIREMMYDLPFEFVEKKNTKGCTVFTIFDMRLAKYLAQFGNCYTKYVPYEIKKLSKELLRVFYDWFVMGDGRKRGIGPGNYYSDDVFSTSEQLVMDLNEIQLKIGYTGSYHMENRQYDRYIEDRLIEGKNCHDMHFSMRNHNKTIVLDTKRKLKVTEEEYEGRVYCVEVENHTFYTMCNNGKCLWSGNSSTLSGHDVAHLITELHWEGHTLVGEMEIHTTPGFRKYGICSTSGDLVANMLISDYLIGVSSRGVGSVNEVPGGYVVVDEDFELIGWDVVLEPSTPNAYIAQNSKDLKPYIESTIINGSPINEKIKKINQILI